MDTTEIINAAEQENGVDDGLLSAGQAMRAANERSQISAEGAVEAFNESRIDSAVQLRGSAQTNEHGTGAAQDVASNAQGAFGLVLDDLGQGQAGPDTIDGAAPAAFAFVGESLLEGVAVGGQTVEGKVQGQFLRPTPDQGSQSPNELTVPLLADHGSQPQAGTDHDRHRHPQDHTALQLDAHFIGLDLLQVQWLNMGLMDGLSMHPRSVLPGHHRPLIQAKRRDYRLARTAVGQQRHYLTHRRFLRPQSVKHRPSSIRKRPSTALASASLAPSLPPHDIPFAHHALVRAPLVGAKYFLKVHFSLPAAKPKGLNEPSILAIYRLVWSYPEKLVADKDPH
jgi:hypothetical protein